MLTLKIVVIKWPISDTVTPLARSPQKCSATLHARFDISVSAIHSSRSPVVKRILKFH